MARITELPNHYFESWNKATKIVQENKIQNNQQVARFSIVNEAFNIKLRTAWYNYPFANGHTISDLIILKAPLLKEDKELLPIIETTSDHNYKKVALCSSYVLKNKMHFKQYMPVRDTVESYKIRRERPTNFTLSNGEHTYTVSPKDVIEIIEE